MGAVEKFLKKTGRAGVLSETIEPGSPAAGMYERRGWIRIVPDHSRYAFNLPENVPGENLHAFLFVDVNARRAKGVSNDSRWREPPLFVSRIARNYFVM